MNRIIPALRAGYRAFRRELRPRRPVDPADVTRLMARLDEMRGTYKGRIKIGED